MRRGVLAASALGLAVIGVFAAPAAAAPPATVRTSISPVDSNGDLKSGYVVKHHYGQASCQSGSLTTGTAYRCYTPQSADSVYDPCWVTSTAAVVDCLPYPWTLDVVQLHVTAGFDDSQPMKPIRTPWGVRLDGSASTGYRCIAAYGSSERPHGHRVTFYCPHRTVLAGAINTAKPAWRVRSYRVRRNSTYQWTGWRRLQIAWFGAPSQPDSSSTGG